MLLLFIIFAIRLYLRFAYRIDRGTQKVERLGMGYLYAPPEGALRIYKLSILISVETYF